MKKILALVVSVLLVMSVLTVAFAANDGSLKISNTTDGATYQLYKVFDATYSGSNVSYTYDGSDSTFLAALQAATNLFEVTQNTAGTYNIVKKDGASDSDILGFIKDNGPTQNAETKAWSGGHLGSVIETKTGNGSDITFSELAYGYYFVTSTVGSLVTINSAVKDVTVIDKNQTTTIDKQEEVEAGTWVYQGLDATEDPIPTASIGDTVNYKVVGQFTRYIGEDKVKKFTWTDVMSSGLTGNKDVTITINGKAPVAPGATIKYYKTVDSKDVELGASEKAHATKTIIEVPTLDSNGNFLYPAVSEYVITYSAFINEDAVLDGAEENTVDLKYTDDNNKDHEVEDDKTEVKNYKIDIIKTDDANKLLDGATFKLYNDATAGTAYDMVEVEAGVYRLKTEEDTASDVVDKMSPVDGKLTIKGLENGTYYLEEVDHPDGYNPLTERKSFTINNADDNATIEGTTYKSGGVQVINMTGSTLPSTGGIGTTIFYVGGGLLVLVAVIFLVTKRRMGSND